MIREQRRTKRMPSRRGATSRGEVNAATDPCDEMRDDTMTASNEAEDNQDGEASVSREEMREVEQARS